ncbi:MAG: 3-dehydroquinate synthase [Peptococcaceae bacterium]|nr:3-dehydroquinate synthase [Peptococcaceae bacterium]
MLQQINVGGSNGYPIFLNASLEELGAYLWEKFGVRTHFLLITNDRVANLYAERVLKGLREFRTDLITVPDSEEEKSLSTIARLTEEAVKFRTDRDSVVLALGGGVIGDLAGFFATIYYRGIRYIQIPTTLLAQVDSSIGGKVAVNHACGKNLLGAFSPPQAVWTDFSTLKTLPWPEIQNGLAETVKHALVADPELFDFIESHADAIRNHDLELLSRLAARSLAVKVKIVSEDEKEHGVRTLLNLGHSFGHALETADSYKGISHGQGVSIGLAAAANLAKDRGLLTEKELARITGLLDMLKLPRNIPPCDAKHLLNLMAADKKNKAGNKILVLPVSIGKSMVVTDCSDDEIIRAWEKVFK